MRGETILIFKYMAQCIILLPGKRINIPPSLFKKYFFPALGKHGYDFLEVDFP